MNAREYKELRGLDDTQVASELSALLGKKIGAGAVKLYSKRELPKAWAEALGVGAAAPPHEPSADPSSSPPFDASVPQADERTHDESPPKAPPGSTVPAEMPSATAVNRITAVYGLFGSAMSSRTGNPGYRIATDTQAPHIARAWLRAAEENEFIRRVVGYLDSGGATGELVQVHVVWLATILYISGRIPDIGGLFGKYARFRIVAVPEPEHVAGESSEQPEPAPAFVGPWAFGNGAGANRAAGAVADDTAAPHP